MKWSYALRIPTTSPLRPSRTTIGNSTRLRPTVKSSSWALNSSPVKCGTTLPAARMNTAVIAVSAARISRNRVDARRNASRLRPCSRSSVKTGTNAALSAASANRLRTRFGIWNAIVNAENGPLVPK